MNKGCPKCKGIIRWKTGEWYWYCNDITCGWDSKIDDVDNEFNTSTFGPLPDPADQPTCFGSFDPESHCPYDVCKYTDDCKRASASIPDPPEDDAIKGDVSVTTDPVSPYKGYADKFSCSECGAPEGAVHIPPCGALIGREDTISVTANPKQAYGDKKVPLHLMPPIAEILTCVALREGAIKYGAWNFRSAQIELMTYVGAIKRHLAAIIDGEWIDPDQVADLPKKPHIAGLLASAAILADAYYNGNLVDNRPAPGKAPELLKDFMAP